MKTTDTVIMFYSLRVIFVHLVAEVKSTAKITTTTMHEGALMRAYNSEVSAYTKNVMGS